MHEHEPHTFSHNTSEAGPDQPSVIRLHSAGDLVAAVPALFGFHPHRSVVAVLLDDRSRLACALRIDLLDAFDAVDRISDASRTAAAASTVVILLYAPHGPFSGLFWALEVDAAVSILRSEGLQVHDALQVDEGRYWSYLCHDPACCPPEGTPVPTGTTELEAQRVVRGGHAVVADRDAVTALYAPRPELAPPAEVFDTERLVLGHPLGERCQQGLADTQTLLDSWTHRGQQAPEQASDHLRARLGLLLADVTVRDYVLGTLASKQDDLTDLTRALTWLALTTTDDLRPALAGTAAALVAMAGDDPAGAWALIDLAHGQALADLLTIGLQVLSPQALRDVFRQALPEVQARIDAA